MGTIEIIDGVEYYYEYDLDEIVPIPAKCTKCGHDWVDKDAIRAPSLACCRCWCDGKLKPHPDHPPVIDAETRRAMSLEPQLRLDLSLC